MWDLYRTRVSTYFEAVGLMKPHLQPLQFLENRLPPRKPSSYTERLQYNSSWLSKEKAHERAALHLSTTKSTARTQRYRWSSSLTSPSVERAAEVKLAWCLENVSCVKNSYLCAASKYRWFPSISLEYSVIHDKSKNRSDRSMIAVVLGWKGTHWFGVCSTPWAFLGGETRNENNTAHAPPI